MKRIVAVVAGLLLSATACGGDEDKATPAPDGPLSGSEATAATSIAKYWRKNDFDKKSAQCLGDRMVREFGVPHLQDLGLLDEAFQAVETSDAVFSSKADAPKAAELIVDCRGMATIMKQGYQGVDDKAAQCLADAFGRDRMIEALIASLEGTAAPDTPSDVTVEMSKCVPSP